MKTLKDLLEQEDLINKASLARKMWDGNKNASIMLAHKLGGKQIKNSSMRITESDTENAKGVLKSFAYRILDFTGK